MSLDIQLTREYHITYDKGETLIPTTKNVFEANITHNLIPMATELGIHKILWTPPPNTTASQLIAPLEAALDKMNSNPDYYKQFDSTNNWGTYNDFLPWLYELLTNCKLYPDTLVSSFT